MELTGKGQIQKQEVRMERQNVVAEVDCNLRHQNMLTMEKPQSDSTEKTGKPQGYKTKSEKQSLDISTHRARAKYISLDLIFQIWIREFDNLKLNDGKSPRGFKETAPGSLKGHGCTTKAVITLAQPDEPSRTDIVPGFANCCIRRGGQFFCAVVFVMIILSDFLKVLHVSAVRGKEKTVKSEGRQTDIAKLSHEHGPQFDEIAVFWVLHFDHTPRVHAAPDFPSPDFQHGVATHHSKRHGFLQGCKHSSKVRAGDHTLRAIHSLSAADTALCNLHLHHHRSLVAGRSGFYAVWFLRESTEWDSTVKAQGSWNT